MKLLAAAVIWAFVSGHEVLRGSRPERLQDRSRYAVNQRASGPGMTMERRLSHLNFQIL